MWVDEVGNKREEPSEAKTGVVNRGTARAPTRLERQALFMMFQELMLAKDGRHMWEGNDAVTIVAEARYREAPRPGVGPRVVNPRSKAEEEKLTSGSGWEL